MNELFIQIKEYFEGMYEKYPIATHIILGGIGAVIVTILTTIIVLICKTFGTDVFFGWLIIIGFICAAIYFLGEAAKKILKLKNKKKDSKYY